MMPSRMMIRSWLANLERSEILEKLAEIKSEHGPDSEQDVRDLLNHEREQDKKGFVLESAAERSLLSEHEEHKTQIAADIEFARHQPAYVGQANRRFDTPFPGHSLRQPWSWSI